MSGLAGPEIRTPSDLVDLQIWLHEQWKPRQLFWLWIHRHHRELISQEGAMFPGSMQEMQPQFHAAWESEAIRRASLWWVGNEMVDLLLACASAIPDDLSFVDLPQMPDSGLVVFQKPWLGLDAEKPEKLIQVHALLWYRAIIRGGLQTMCMSSYQYVDFDAGLSGPELQQAIATGLIPREKLLYSTEVVAALHGRAWMPLGKSDWPIHDDLGQPAPWHATSEASASAREDRAVLAAFWHLLHQEGITRTEEMVPDRPARRRAKRAGTPHEAPVRLITLRRALQVPEDAPEAVPVDPDARREWSHRWLVGFPTGTWRWQRHGKGNAQRKLIWIAPYIKGPADKPLSTKPTVHAWVR